MSWPHIARERLVQWAEAREFLRRRLAASLDRVDPTVIEDLTQEALLRLLRALRREEVRNLEALMTEIARRTRIDFLRHRRVRMAHMEPLTPAAEAVPAPETPPAWSLGHPGRRVRFIVLEYFQSHHARCLELGRRFFAGQDWHAVARHLGVQHATARQQWSRCLARLREHAAGDPGLLKAWSELEP